jgi:hypothetical protein
MPRHRKRRFLSTKIAFLKDFGGYGKKFYKILKIQVDRVEMGVILCPSVVRPEKTGTKNIKFLLNGS